MGIPFPEEYGGGGGDTLSYALAVEELARIDSSVGDHARARTPRSARSRSTSSAPTSRRSGCCPTSAPARKLGAFGLTEPEAGSDAGNVADPRAARRRRVGDRRREAVHHQRRHRDLRARRDHRGHRRRGDGEISNLIVENGTPGYEQGEPYRKMGWNASDTRPLTFTDCRVPEENLLGRAGRRLQAVPPHPRHRPDRRRGDGRRPRPGRARRGDRLREGAPRLRPADLEVPGDPGEDRRPLGPDRGRAPARPTARRWRRTPAQSFTLTAAQAKLITGRLAVRATEEAVQIHGGYGYIEEYPVCRFYRDAKILTIGEGTDEVQQMVIARAARLLSGPKASICGFVRIRTRCVRGARLDSRATGHRSASRRSRWEARTATRGGSRSRPCGTSSTGPAVVVPICVSRLDGRRHELSPKAMRFAEALSFTDRWSRITDARNRDSPPSERRISSAAWR